MTWTVTFRQNLVSTPLCDLGRQSFPLSYTATHITSPSPLISCRTRSDKQRAKTTSQPHTSLYIPPLISGRKDLGHRHNLKPSAHQKLCVYLYRPQSNQHFFIAHTKLWAHPPSDTLATPVEGEREQFGHQLGVEEHKALEMSVVEMALSTIDGVPNLYVGG